MAATCIISIHINKGKTARYCIGERLDYIMNPKKTDGGILVSTNACSPETAADEFMLFRQEYQQNTGRTQDNEVIGYHVRQAFKPEEITPEEANEIGKELASRMTSDQFAYVVATHIDKHHVHNHIIICSTDLEGQHKYRDVKQSAKDLAQISDSLCREHGLSVIQNPEDKTVTYDKWQDNQRRFTHRDELRMIIDTALRMQPDGFDALMQLLEEAGCRIKRGAQITIKLPEGKRYICLDTLGEEYDETSLRRTLAHDHVHIPKIPRGDFTESQVKRLIDIEAKLRTGKGKGYQVWAERNNIAVHFDDKEPPNPHAHILCTMRSMDEQGHWNDKTKTAYALDENGNRIMGKNGKWKRIRIDTVDWNDRKYCEIWRHEWEVMQNAALEDAGRTERVDMRSFERQGIETAPQVHLGPAAFALEKQGIRTELGNHNNAVKQINNLFSAIRRKLKSMLDWLKELKEIISDHEKLESPGDFPLYEVLFAYYDLREKQRWDWHPGARSKAGLKDFKEKTSLFAFLQEHDIYSVNDFGRLINDTNNKFTEMNAARKSKEKRIRDIDAILDAVKTLKELNPIQEKYDHIFFKGAKEKYRTEHADELEKIKKARRLLYKLNVTLPINSKTLKAESTKLRGEVESMLPELESLKAELDQQMQIRSHIRKVMPELLAKKTKDGKQSFEDVSEEIQNAKELRELLEESAERALHHDPAPEPIQQHLTHDQQKNAKKQEQGDR